MAWIIERFSNIATLINGRAYLMPELLDNGKYRIVRVGNFTGKDEWFYSDMELDDEKYCSKGDLLYKWACTFGPEIWKEEKVIYHYHIWKVVNDSSRIDKLFLYYYLKYNTPMWLGATNGSTMVHITKSSMEKKKIYIPDDLKEQKTIANILNDYDELIENNNKRIQLLEDMAESLYKEWFVRFRLPGYKNIETKEKSAKGWVFGNHESGQAIPESWDFDELINIAEFKRGKNITSSKMIEGKIPVIAAGIEPSGYHNQANVKGCSLTVSASGANAGYLAYHLENIWAADCSYYQNDKNIWFVYNALKFLQPVISNMQVGSAQPHVYAKNINRLSTIIPTKEIIQKYCEKVSPFYGEIKILKDKNELLIQQRDSLLPRLMSGKLEVSS
ncbi:MAG: restriction endonuclease subunit S [Christensenella sp.]|nr:restriction endonuclease subunit S [Christensenella sp.]